METEPVWAVVELMGHVRLAGRLTEEEKFGSKMGRLDIPVTCPKCGGGSCSACPDSVNEYVTRYFGGASIYSVTICTEEVARFVARSASDVAPVKPWELPKAIAGRPATNDIPFGDRDTDERLDDDRDM